MKQVLADPKGGGVHLELVPDPVVRPGTVLVRTRASVISTGTERGMIDLAKSSLLGKARARPDLVKKVLARARVSGVKYAMEAVRSRLARPMPLGYSAAGVVEAVGPEVTEFSVGDRVAIAGAGYANHAELNVVPVHLAAAIPEGLAFERAAFATIASIALQGLRIGGSALGEVVVVSGLGLIGLLTVQLLRAAGCRVVGVDPVAARREMAAAMGAECVMDPVDSQVWSSLASITDGHGADAVYVTASTSSSAPIVSAGEWCRKKGVVVVVGSVGMDVPRRSFYEKELALRLSTSYGPGRYDPEYEEGGLDYPYAYVRWTEQRNLGSVLHLMASGRLDPAPLVTHSYPLERATEAYDVLTKEQDAALGILLTMPGEVGRASRVAVQGHDAVRAEGVLGVGFVGAGQYAAQFLIPPLARRKDVRLTGLVTTGGAASVSLARKEGFAFASTAVGDLLSDQATDVVFVATRHDSHAELTERAIAAGRHVFVEKPVAVTEPELDRIVEAYAEANRLRPVGLMVGLNRRFAPMVVRMRDALAGTGSLSMTYVVNAGPIDPGSWVLAPEQGGGMLVSEACHFVDVMQALCGSVPRSVSATRIESPAGQENNFQARILFADGSVGTLTYATSGDPAGGKEHLLVQGRGLTASLSDFRRLDLARGGHRKVHRAFNQDKGQRAMLDEFLRGIRDTASAPVPFRQIEAGMRTIFAIRQSMMTGLETEISCRTVG